MKKNEDAAAKKKPKTSAAQLRVQKGAVAIGRVWLVLFAYCQLVPVCSDITELDLPSTMVTNFPNPEDLLNFELVITPDEGKPHPFHLSGTCF